MTTGPGKYDDICTEARVSSKAKAVLLVVLGGKHGEGFSIQSESLGIMEALPEMLRNIADSVERDLNQNSFEI